MLKYMCMYIFDVKYKKFENHEYKKRGVQLFQVLGNI